jgi:hypothetical protein
LVPAKNKQTDQETRGRITERGIRDGGLEREILEKEGLFSLLILERKHLYITVPPAEACPRPVH